MAEEASARKARKQAPPPELDGLVDAVQSVVGKSVTRDQIRKELVNHAYNVNATATAFLDSERALFSRWRRGLTLELFLTDQIKAAEPWEEVKTKRIPKDKVKAEVGLVFFRRCLFSFVALTVPVSRTRSPRPS